MSALENALRLLEEERRLLKAGDFEALKEVLPKKQELALQLAEMANFDVDAADRLRAAADRNGELLEAARQGLALAEARIRDIRQGMAQTTYCRDGARRQMSQHPGKIAQRL